MYAEPTSTSRGKAGLELAHGLDLPGHADERVFRRLVAVGGREGGRTLDVRVVVRAAARDVDAVTPSDANISRKRTGSVRSSSSGLSGLHAEAVAIRQQVIERLGTPAPFFRPRVRGRVVLEGHDVKRTSRTPICRSGHGRTHPPDQLADETACGSRNSRRNGPGAGVSAEQLVTEIPVAALQVHEVEARPGRSLAAAT